MRNIRKHEESVMDAFKTIKITDKDGKEHPVPVIYGTPEKAEAYMLQENVGYKDGLVIDKIRLPLISLISTEIGRSHIIFEGQIHTLYREDMNQIVEQILHLDEDFDNISVRSVGIDHGTEDNKTKVLRGSFVAQLG